MKKIFVGNLAWAVTDCDLKSLFSTYGDVNACLVIRDHVTGQSRGFGFVEMRGQHAAEAIAELDGHDFRSRSLEVSAAKLNPSAAA
ncbi:MAG: RNA-binding protein [Gammaproteobacteria bacterium]|nr:RNA-binding protein [Gammaproteobacteria bacterium]